MTSFQAIHAEVRSRAPGGVSADAATHAIVVACDTLLAREPRVGQHQNWFDELVTRSVTYLWDAHVALSRDTDPT